MQDLARQRCFNHGDREAVALCPDCKKMFCRECITEHEDRVICATCLARIRTGPAKKKGPAFFRPLLRGVLFLGSLMGLWLAFFYLGQWLLEMPASFHEGTLWQKLWQNL